MLSPSQVSPQKTQINYKQMQEENKMKGKNPRYVTIRKTFNNRRSSQGTQENWNRNGRSYNISPQFSQEQLNNILSVRSNVQSRQSQMNESQQNFNQKSKKYLKQPQQESNNTIKINGAVLNHPSLQFKQKPVSRSSRVSRSVASRNMLSQELNDDQLSQLNQVIQTEAQLQNTSQNNLQSLSVIQSAQTLDENRGKPIPNLLQNHQKSVQVQSTQQDEPTPSQGKESPLKMAQSPQRSTQCNGFNLSQSNFSRSQQHFSSQFENLLKKNEDYMRHLRGDCLCGKCLCGKCKCPKLMFLHDSEKNQQTSYQKEFHQKSQYKQNLPQITMDFHSQNKATGPMELSTINKKDFIPHEVKSVRYGKQKQKKEEQPFMGASSYKLNFINWGNFKPMSLAPKNTTTIVPDLHLTAKTIYKDDFNKGNSLNNDNDLQFIRQWGKRDNYKNPDFPFQPHTTNNSTYKFFKNKKNEKIEDPNRKAKYEPNPSYYGQFKSSQQQQFDNSHLIQCPSRKALNLVYKNQVKKNEQDALDYQKQLKIEKD